jgi:hypothetical protein
MILLHYPRWLLLMPLSLWALEYEISGLVDLYMQQAVSQKSADLNSTPESYAQLPVMTASRARLHVTTQMAKHWHAHAQAQILEYNNAQLGLDIFDDINPTTDLIRLEIAQAYVDYQWSKYLDFRLGKIPLTAISVTQMGLQSAIGDKNFRRSAGTVFCQAGEKIGVGTNVSVGPIRYDMSIWQQSPLRRVWDLPDYSAAIGTDQQATTLEQISSLLAQTTYGLQLDDFRGNNLSLSYAGRLSLVYNTRPHTHWSLGIGYSLEQLNQPIVSVCVGSYDGLGGNTAYIPPNYQMTAYNRLIQVALDATRVYGWWLFQLGYQYQRLRVDNSQHYYYQEDSNPILAPNLRAADPNATERSMAFDNNGLAHAFWIQTGCLLLGHRYNMDLKDGSIASIETSPQYGALEIYGRAGRIHRHNMLALLTQSGQQDLSTNDRAQPMTPADPDLVQLQAVSLSNTAQYLLVAIDNTGTQADTTALIAADQVSFHSHEDSWVIGLSYAMTRQSQFKAEFEVTKRCFDKTPYHQFQSSLYLYKNSSVRLRWETIF